jgi:hypothetical protein
MAIGGGAGTGDGGLEQAASAAKAPTIMTEPVNFIARSPLKCPENV